MQRVIGQRALNASACCCVIPNVKRRVWRCGLFAALLGGLVWAPVTAAMDVSSAINGIEKRYNHPKTMELLFKQTYTRPGRLPQAESGKLYLRKPRRMRWEYNDPPGKLFLSDGKNVYFYSPTAKRVEKMPLKESGDMRTPLAFLMGRLDLNRDFREFRSRPEGRNLRIVAIPKSRKAPYRQVVFLVTPSFQIRRLTIIGQDSSVMEFRFSDEKINPPLAADLFRFVMPAGAELVEADGGTAASR